MQSYGFRLALPDDWVQIPMDATALESMHALVGHLGSRFDASGVPIAEAQAELRALAHDIENFDVVFAAAWVAGTEEAVVQANLTALLIQAGSVAELDDPVWDLETIDDTTHERTIIRRTRIRTTDGVAVRFGIRRVGTAEFFVEVPGRPLWLLITFTSPTVAIWDDLVDLFDTIASSARFE